MELDVAKYCDVLARTSVPKYKLVSLLCHMGDYIHIDWYDQDDIRVKNISVEHLKHYE